MDGYYAFSLWLYSSAVDDYAGGIRLDILITACTLAMTGLWSP
jgi:hypothetical protein